MTTAIIMLALLTTMDGRQFRADGTQLLAASRVDLLGDGRVDDSAAGTDSDDAAAELHIAMFGDWTLDTQA